MIEEFMQFVNRRAGENSDSVSHTVEYMKLLNSLDDKKSQCIHSTINEYENASYIQGFSDAVKLIAWLP